MSHCAIENERWARFRAVIRLGPVIDMSAFQIWLAVLIGWLDRQERDVIAYLMEENRVLRAQVRNGLGFPLHLVPPGAEVRLAPPPAPRAPGQTEGGPSHDASRPDVAHRHHRHRLLDGTRAYLHAVIDNFSRRILAWRVADTFAPVNSVAVLLDASRGATPSDTPQSCWQMQASRI